MKIMEFVLRAEGPTGMIMNEFNLVNTSLSEVTNASLNIIESLGYAPGTPATPVANSVFDRWLELTYPNVEIREFYCRDIYNVNDFAQVTVSGVGWQGSRATGNAEPAFMAAKLKSTRTRQDIKAGYKALPPMLDVDVVNSTGAIAASYITLMTTLCTALGNGTSPFVGVTQAYFAWAIVGKQKYTTPSGKTAYRYYPTMAEQAENMAYPVSWAPVERATTQDSRKFGKGR